MADRYIPEHRRTQFKAKNTFKPEELRRRREEQQVEIRKAKREENLAKRRGITGGDGSARLGASLGAEADSDDDTVPSESQVRGAHNFAGPSGEEMPILKSLLEFCMMFSASLPPFPSFAFALPLFTFSGGAANLANSFFRLWLTAIIMSMILRFLAAPALPTL
jgi:hypothetical protein